MCHLHYYDSPSFPSSSSSSSSSLSRNCAHRDDRGTAGLAFFTTFGAVGVSSTLGLTVVGVNTEAAGTVTTVRAVHGAAGGARGTELACVVRVFVAVLARAVQAGALTRTIGGGSDVTVTGAGVDP